MGNDNANQDVKLIVSPDWFIKNEVIAQEFFRLIKPWFPETHWLQNKNKEYVVNYQIIALFKIKVHKKDLILLKMIQNYFNGIGKIYEEGDAVTFVVSSVKEVKIIVNHFNKYPLVTQKQADFELFKKAF